MQELIPIDIDKYSFSIEYSILLLRGSRVSNEFSNKRLTLILSEMHNEFDAKATFGRYIDFLFPNEEPYLEIHSINQLL